MDKSKLSFILNERADANGSSSPSLRTFSTSKHDPTDTETLQSSDTSGANSERNSDSGQSSSSKRYRISPNLPPQPHFESDHQNVQRLEQKNQGSFMQLSLTSHQQREQDYSDNSRTQRLNYPNPLRHTQLLHHPQPLQPLFPNPERKLMENVVRSRSDKSELLNRSRSIHALLNHPDDSINIDYKRPSTSMDITPIKALFSRDQFHQVLSHHPLGDMSNMTPKPKAKADSLRCKECFQSFPDIVSLNVHYRQFHVEARPFHCESCEATFRRKADLNKHNRLVHEKIKPFQCHICGFSFGQKGDLRKHLKTHESASQS